MIDRRQAAAGIRPGGCGSSAMTGRRQAAKMTSLIDVNVNVNSNTVLFQPTVLRNDDPKDLT